MTPDELRSDTHEAVSSLEDVCGEKVISYRAPAFSIGQANKWAIEILAENGIERDASIFPAERDFGGFASFPADTPVIISHNGTSLKEFPICMTRLLGKELAYSGGGYFRFFPYSYIRKRMQESPYAISYFHIGDLLCNKGGMMSRKEYETYFKESGALKNRLIRYVKSNLGTKHAFDKMAKLIASCDYKSLREADLSMDWSKTKKIEL